MKTARLLQLQDGARDGNSERRPWNRREQEYGTEKPGHGTEKPAQGTEKPGHADMVTGILGHADPLEYILDIYEDGTGILELRHIKILGHGNMVPGTQKRFCVQEMWITGTRFPGLLFLENENMEDTGTEQGIFNQGSENRGVLRACSPL